MSRWAAKDAERIICRARHRINTCGWFTPEEARYLRGQTMVLLSGGLADELPEEHAVCLRGLLYRLEQAAATYEREPDR